MNSKAEQASDPIGDVQAESEVHLSAAEAAQIAQRRSMPALLIFELVREEGEEELNRSTMALWCSGFAAGLSISFSVVAQGAVYAFLPAHSAGFAVALALAYTVGFLIVIMARQQLFTENTLTVVAPLVVRPGWEKLRLVARLWFYVLAANMAGTLLFAICAAYTPMFSAELSAGMLKASLHGLRATGSEAFFLAIPSGFLIATLVWTLAAARQHAVALVLILVGVIALGEFTHVVAGSAEAFYLVLRDVRTLAAVTLDYLLPVLAGNILGGTAIFAILAYGQIFEERQDKAKKGWMRFIKPSIRRR